MLLSGRKLLLHLSPSLWASLEPVLGQSGVPLEVLLSSVLEPLDARLEACRAMLCAAERERLPVLAGQQTLAAAAASVPLLRAACQIMPPTIQAPLAPERVVATNASLTALMRAVLDHKLDPTHALMASARGLEGRWAALFMYLDRAAEDEDLLSLTESRLEAVLCEHPQGCDPQGAPSLLFPGETVVRIGLRTGDETAKKYPAHSAGTGRSPAVHLTVRAVDHRTGVASARTLFLSNCRPPHHWQHRVFPDGEVLEPLLEDEVGEVELGNRTARLMQLYCTIVAAARAAATAAAAAYPRQFSDEDALQTLSEHLFASEDLRALMDATRAQPIASVWRGLLREPPSSETLDVLQRTGDAASRKGMSAEAKRAEATLLASKAAAFGTAATDEATTTGRDCPLEWLLHSVHFRLDTEEGALVYETPFVLDGHGGWHEVINVPALSSWPSAGLETQEARTIRNAVESNLVCDNPAAVIERLRAGEHAQLQALLCDAIDGCTLLLDSQWLPAVRGSLRLFSGGMAFDSPRFGPMVLPFRIHLAAVAAFNLSGEQGPGALIFTQKADEHGYGPLAVLPERCFDGAPCVLRIAIVVPCRGELHHTLQEKVWPHWARLFDECCVHLEVARMCPEWVRLGLDASAGAL